MLARTPPPQHNAVPSSPLEGEAAALIGGVVAYASPASTALLRNALRSGRGDAGDANSSPPRALLPQQRHRQSAPAAQALAPSTPVALRLLAAASAPACNIPPAAAPPPQPLAQQTLPTLPHEPLRSLPPHIAQRNALVARLLAQRSAPVVHGANNCAANVTSGSVGGNGLADVDADSSHMLDRLIYGHEFGVEGGDACGVAAGAGADADANTYGVADVDSESYVFADKVGAGKGIGVIVGKGAGPSRSDNAGDHFSNASALSDGLAFNAAPQRRSLTRAASPSVLAAAAAARQRVVAAAPCAAAAAAGGTGPAPRPCVAPSSAGRSADARRLAAERAATRAATERAAREKQDREARERVAVRAALRAQSRADAAARRERSLRVAAVATTAASAQHLARKPIGAAASSACNACAELTDNGGNDVGSNTCAGGGGNNGNCSNGVWGEAIAAAGPPPSPRPEEAGSPPPLPPPLALLLPLPLPPSCFEGSQRHAPAAAAEPAAIAAHETIAPALAPAPRALAVANADLDARRRAAQRLRASKEEEALRATRTAREAAQREAAKWAERDRKIAAFLARQQAAASIAQRNGGGLGAEGGGEGHNHAVLLGAVPAARQRGAEAALSATGGRAKSGCAAIASKGTGGKNGEVFAEMASNNGGSMLDPSMLLNELSVWLAAQPAPEPVLADGPAAETPEAAPRAAPRRPSATTSRRPSIAGNSAADMPTTAAAVAALTARRMSHSLAAAVAAAAATSSRAKNPPAASATLQDLGAQVAATNASLLAGVARLQRLQLAPPPAASPASAPAAVMPLRISPAEQCSSEDGSLLASALVASAPVAAALVASVPVAAASVAAALVASVPVAAAPVALAPASSALVANSPAASAPAASAPDASYNCELRPPVRGIDRLREAARLRAQQTEASAGAGAASGMSADARPQQKAAAEDMVGAGAMDISLALLLPADAHNGL
jgi:hypothetical protein